MDNLRALHEAATPEPWDVGFDDESGVGEDGDGAYITTPTDENTDLPDVVVAGGTDDWGVAVGVRNPPDAALIAATRNALPLMLDVIEAADALSLALEGVEGRPLQDWIEDVAAKRQAYLKAKAAYDEHIEGVE